jgi:hypothetical protein
VSFIDVEPSKQQELQDAKKAIVGNIPLMEEPVSNLITLPRGLFDGSKWETEAELKELTGADEEALARFKDVVDFFDAVLVYGTVRIGAIDLSDMNFAERQSTLAGLLVGEREQLFIHITSITYGDDKVITHTCPACDVDSETTLQLSEDIVFPTMENPYSLTNTMVTSKKDTITYRLATGADQLTVLKRKGASSAEQNTLMLSECITEINGAPVVDPIANARNLSMGDRRKILEALTAAQPSPDLNIKVTCPSCAFEMILPLSWGDIFRP